MAGVVIRRDKNIDTWKDEDTDDMEDKDTGDLEGQPCEDIHRGVFTSSREPSVEIVLDFCFSELLNKLLLFKTHSLGYFATAALAY